MGRKDDLGQRIKVMRQSRGYTQEALAKLVGAAGSSTVGMWETGKRTPDTETLEALADIFNVPMSAFFDESDWQDKVPRTPEARILAKGIDQMPESERRKAIRFMTMMFEQYADFFEQEDKTDGN